MKGANLLISTGVLSREMPGFPFNDFDHNW